MLFTNAFYALTRLSSNQQQF